MALRSMHIRVTEEEYDFICALANELHCSQSKLIRKVIYDMDMKSIVAAYRQRQGNSYLENFMECSLDDQSRNLLDDCVKNLNENTQQIRKIGTNVSALIRDIRNGKVVVEKNSIMDQLDLIMRANETAMKKQGSLAEKMSEVVNHTKIKVGVKEDRWAG